MQVPEEAETVERVFREEMKSVEQVSALIDEAELTKRSPELGIASYIRGRTEAYRFARKDELDRRDSMKSPVLAHIRPTLREKDSVERLPVSYRLVVEPFPIPPPEIEAYITAMIAGPCRRALDYLDAIDRRGGKARRMDFLRIAGTGTAANVWISFFVAEGIIAEIQESDRRRIYQKTNFGKAFHEILRDHPRVVNLIVRCLSGGRLKPKR